MQRNSYRNINKFGTKVNDSEVISPLTYCINDTADRMFLHGGNSVIYGQNSKPCQSFLSEYCAQNWDDACEYASNNKEMYFPNDLVTSNIDGFTYSPGRMSAGDILIRNTATEKYLVSMGNCMPKYEPFDPTVANSPMIKYWIPNEYGANGNCIPIYSVNPKTIDNDIVMNKILAKPNIALDILINIYNNFKRNNALNELQNTNLGKFFMMNSNVFN